MTSEITVLAPFRLLPGKIEADLLAASDAFERDFVRAHPGILRRELVRKPDGRYMDIVRFRSEADMAAVIEAERHSAACRAFFGLMEMAEADVEVCAALASHAGSWERPVAWSR